MSFLIRERKDNTEEIWYSEDYLKKQIESAYRAGLHKGITVEFHALEPRDEEAVELLISEFKRRLEHEYHIAFNDGKVWKT